MAEIDMNKQEYIIYKIAKKHKKIKIIKYITSILTIVQITAGINLSDGLPKTAAFIAALTTASLGVQIYNNKIEKEKNKIFDQELKATDKYKECIKEYDKFITNLANLIRSLNIKNPKEIIVFYEFLLVHGLLSKKTSETKLLEHEYHDYKYEENIMEELTGARVASGKTVCRHQSAMLIDLLVELGIKACNVSAHTATLKEARQLIRKKSKKLNHSMVGIIEDDNKYIYDCTVGSFVVISEENKRLATQFTAEEMCYYLPKEYKRFNIKTLETRMLFEKISKCELDKEELIRIREKIKRLLEEKYVILSDFYLFNEKRINRIAELENELCPHSDEPINEWILKL